MRLYVELAKKSFQRQVAYRSATLAGFSANLFFGAVRAAVMVAVYGAQPQVAGYSLTDAITYTGITQGLIAAIALWGWYDVIRNIKSGEIATDLSRPFDYYNFWLAQDVGRSIYQLFARGISIMVVYGLLFRITVPGSIEQWALLALSIAFALLLSFAWRFLINATAFWMTDAVGFARMSYFLVLFPSGFFIPIAFMPAWLQVLCRATPFPGFVDTPVTIYLGHARGADALALIASQALWSLILMVLGRVVLEAGRRKLVIQGG
jgi:ABC-2 type transport system permease protein